ncbi:Cation channel sperm-associated protein 3 [Kappamyces sp. JEL0680]|nr:Cation channel sperm-associated protein 3 [Kappamyces sp. JEL0680]
MARGDGHRDGDPEVGLPGSNLWRIYLRLADWEWRRDNSWSLFCREVAKAGCVDQLTRQSRLFRYAVFAVVCVDTIRLLYEADVLAQSEYIAVHPSYYTIQSIKLVCFSFYLWELAVRISADLDLFFRDLYNWVDLFVVCDYAAVWIVAHTFPYFGLYTGLRILRGALVVNALLQTMRTSVMDVLFLTFMSIFILGMLGHYCFGLHDDQSGAYNDWNTLPKAFLAVWVYICGDNWLPYQDRLREAGYSGSHFFSILLMVVGNFMIANLFIGVISQNVYEASQAERLQELAQQREAKMLKRELFLKKQQRDLLQLKTLKNGSGFQEIIRSLAGTLRHDELVPSKQLPMNLLWLETFVLTLHYHENAMFRCQQDYFAIAHSLGEMVDRRLQNKEV